MNDFTIRMLRLNGEQPTARDKWQAFYRIYRLAKRSEDSHNLMGGALDCLFVFGMGSWIRTVSELEHNGVDRGHWPKFLRKRMLESERRRRIYANGDYDELLRMDTRCAVRTANEHGIEMTPEEVGSVRARLCSLMRAKAAEIDLRVPAGDADLIRFFRQTEER